MSTETDDIAQEVERTIERLNRVGREIGRVIFGRERVVDETLITILAGGHVLLVGVPGSPRPSLPRPWRGAGDGAEAGAVHDKMPADILGSGVLEESAAGSGTASSPARSSPSC